MGPILVLCLIAKGLTPKTADRLLNAFENNCKKAKQLNLAPKSTFRDLERLAEQLIKAKQAKHREEKEPIQDEVHSPIFD